MWRMPPATDLEQPDTEQRQQPDHERAAVARHDSVVDRVADNQRRRDRSRLPQQPGDDRADNTAGL